MSLAPNKALLVTLTKDLLLRWEQTRESWHDAKSLEFEKQYINELATTVDQAVEVIEKLDKLLTKVRSDCE